MYVPSTYSKCNLKSDEMGQMSILTESYLRFEHPIQKKITYNKKIRTFYHGIHTLQTHHITYRINISMFCYWGTFLYMKPYYKRMIALSSRCSVGSKHSWALGKKATWRLYSLSNGRAERGRGWSLSQKPQAVWRKSFNSLGPGPLDTVLFVLRIIRHCYAVLHRLAARDRDSSSHLIIDVYYWYSTTKTYPERYICKHMQWDSTYNQRFIENIEKKAQIHSQASSDLENSIEWAKIFLIIQLHRKHHYIVCYCDARIYVCHRCIWRSSNWSRHIQKRHCISSIIMLIILYLNISIIKTVMI